MSSESAHDTALGGDPTLGTSAVTPTVSKGCSEVIQNFIRQLGEENTYDTIVNEERAKDTENTPKDLYRIAEYKDDAFPSPHCAVVSKCEMPTAGFRCIRKFYGTYDPSADSWEYTEREANATRSWSFSFIREWEKFYVEYGTGQGEPNISVSYTGTNGVKHTMIPSEILELCQAIDPSCCPVIL